MNKESFTVILSGGRDGSMEAVREVGREVWMQ